jgi:hypothetical protein
MDEMLRPIREGKSQRYVKLHYRVRPRTSKNQLEASSTPSRSTIYITGPKIYRNGFLFDAEYSVQKFGGILIELKSMAVYRVSAMKRPDFIALS